MNDAMLMLWSIWRWATMACMATCRAHPQAHSHPHPQAILSRMYARQVSHRWRPTAIILHDTAHVNPSSLKAYTRAQIALESSSFAVVGSEPGLVLYVICKAPHNARRTNVQSVGAQSVGAQSVGVDASVEDHIVTAVLWDANARDSKVECFRAFREWHSKTLPHANLVSSKLTRIDTVAWWMSMREHET